MIQSPLLAVYDTTEIETRYLENFTYFFGAFYIMSLFVLLPNCHYQIDIIKNPSIGWCRQLIGLARTIMFRFGCMYGADKRLRELHFNITLMFSYYSTGFWFSLFNF